MPDMFVKLSASSNAGTGYTLSTYLAGKSGWDAAVSKLGAGDTLYLLEPDGGGDIYINKETGMGRGLRAFDLIGTAVNYITIKPYTGHTINLSGGDNREYPPLPDPYTGALYIYLLWVRGNYIKIEDITIKNWGSSGLLVGGDETDTYSYIDVSGCTVTNMRERAMIALNVANLTIENNVLEYCDNDSSKNPVYKALGRTDHSAALSTRNCDSAVVKYNVIHDNAGEGFNCDGTPRPNTYTNGISIHHNKFYNNCENNLYIHGLAGSENKTIYNNEFYFTPDSYYYNLGWNFASWRAGNLDLGTIEDQWNYSRCDCANWDIYNNVFAQGACGIWYHHVQSTPGAHRDIVVEQNTFINNNVNLLGDNVESPASNVVRNNVFVVGSGQRQTASMFSGLIATHDYNCWHETGTGVGPESTVTGANDLNEDPDLVDLTATLDKTGVLDPSNYVPDSGASSPLIDAGVDTSWTSDFFGNTRSAGSFDIGIAESAGATDNLIPAWENSDESGGVVTLNVDTTTTFTNTTSEVGVATVERLLWEFEGGNPSTSSTSSVGVYWNQIGTHDVSLTVWDDTNSISRTTTDRDYVQVKSATGDTASIAYDVVQFDSGDTTISHSLGVSPQFALFVYGGVIALDTNIDDIDFGFSVCDTSPISSQQSCNASEDGGTNGGFRRASSNAVRRYTTSDSIYVTGTITAVSSSDITMSWSGTTTNSEKGYVILIGGASVSAATATTITSLDTVNDSEDVAGDFNLAIALSTMSLGASHVVTSLGFAVDGGNQVCVACGDKTSSATGEPVALYYDDAIASKPGTNGYVTVTFTDTYTRFKLNGGLLSTSSTADAMHVVLANIGIVGASCEIIDIPTSTGTTSYSLDFDPGLIIAGMVNVSTASGEKDLGATGGAIGIYSTDGTTEFSYGYTIEDGSSVNNVMTYASAGWKQYGDDQAAWSTKNSATVLGTSEWAVDLDPAGGGKAAVLALEDAGGAIGINAEFRYTFDGNNERQYPVVNEGVNFIDLSVPTSGQSLDSWGWDFGDGTTSTYQNPTHTFSESRPYNITLEITDDGPNTISTSDTIFVAPDTVTEGWTVTLNPDPSYGEAPFDVGVDWSDSSWDGLTIVPLKSYMIIYKYIDGVDMFGDRYYRSYSSYGTSATITVTDTGVYSLAIVAGCVDDAGDTTNIVLNLPDLDSSYSPLYTDIIRAYDDDFILVDIEADTDLRYSYVGPKTIHFTWKTYPQDSDWFYVDWDFGDGSTQPSDVTGSYSNTYSSVSSATVYTVEATGSFFDLQERVATVEVSIVPDETATRTELEIIALTSLAEEALGCISTTDWSKTGGQTYVYEATLERPWTASTARVTEDGALLTSQASVGDVDSNAGSYYVTFSDPDITIYVHTTASDSPITNGSRYRFIRPA